MAGTLPFSSFGRGIGVAVAIAAVAAPAQVWAQSQGANASQGSGSTMQRQGQPPSTKSIPIPAQVGIVDKAEIKNRNGVMCITGGIARTGQARTEAIGSGMNLELVFAKGKSGDDMADVDVAVADKAGHKVLNVQSSDPLLFAQLQPGSYKVTATAEGKSVERMVTVPAKGQRTERFVW